MYVIAKHTIDDPQQFWSIIQQAAPHLPADMKVVQVLPSTDGASAVCLWEANSADIVKTLVDTHVGHVSSNEFFEVDTTQAVGLPPVATGA